jgi:hypothetical protein
MPGKPRARARRATSLSKETRAAGGFHDAWLHDLHGSPSEAPAFQWSEPGPPGMRQVRRSDFSPPTVPQARPGLTRSAGAGAASVGGLLRGGQEAEDCPEATGGGRLAAVSGSSPKCQLGAEDSVDKPLPRS